ncbi:uncharacterized protein CC84DRAFT_490789 [Paraphaeosphaeria sporulosa]|uniref:Protein BIG1 n=1 Tax=Paraphaeosphaeria sporulosa TaxID=1460663 RepID=A0A177CTK7_9PLEO|nr:uncharacterized protein CC84DRAFT_490789 [Paraphaeosphaeria sporulosa]OAG10616.1 hypothetical protein CC84DRAFT_490789 [Paraphaeosphaeria sporulosa]
MLSNTFLSALAGALFLSTATALPSRTHCRCTITLADASPSPPSTYHDSLENPDTLVASTSTPPDLCVALGPSLENLRTANPALYDSYISKTDAQQLAAATTAQKPLSTTILLRLAAQQGFQNLGVVLPGAPARDGGERIECRAETGGEEAWSAYQVSWVTLVVLQVVVVLVVVACVAEGVMFGMRWMAARTPTALITLPLPIPGRPARLRLSGEERRLLAIPVLDQFDMRSPGVEKKLRVYASPGWKAQRYAYIEDEDDEFNRPVM